MFYHKKNRASGNNIVKKSKKLRTKLKKYID